MMRQGFPAAMTFSGTSFVTMLPEPMIEFFPIVTPGLITALPPIHTLLQIVTGFANSSPRFLVSASIG
jgi:hypothetical protein